MTETAVAAAEPSRWPIDHCAAPDCSRPIIWGLTAGLRRMPVDAESAKNGNVLLRPWPGRVEPEAHVVSNPARLFGKTTYVSHFVSCPQADKFRRPTRARRVP